MSDGPAFADDLRVALLSVRTPDRRPHLANASVALQPSELTALGCTEPTMVLHWILSPELLPLVGTDVPVCGANRAWRFGCVPPCMLGAETSASVSFLSEDCAVFCQLLNDAHGDGPLAGRFRQLLERGKRIHVFPCMRGAPFGLDELGPALDHPASLLSLHVEEGNGAHELLDRISTLAPCALPWPVLRGPADGDLILPAAWDTALTAKQTGLCRPRRMHAYIISHARDTPHDVLEDLAKGVRAFFYAATPASTLGTRVAEVSPLPPNAAAVLTGRHWLAGGAAQGQLALLGFLPSCWSYVRDLYSRRTGRAIQKAPLLVAAVRQGPAPAHVSAGAQGRVRRRRGRRARS